MSEAGYLKSAGVRYRHNLAESFRPKLEPGRDFQLDAMKGFTIILVVLGHTLEKYVPMLGLTFWWRVIYSFHMPMFFFLSGYVAYASTKKHSASALLARRAKNLVVPFLSWNFLFGTVIWLASRSPGYGTYSYNLVRNPNSGLWFLWALFLCFVALAVAMALEKYLKVFAYLVVLVVVSAVPLVTGARVTNYLGWGLLESYLLFFVAGYLLRRYKEPIKRFAAAFPLPSGLLKVVAVAAFPMLVIIGLLSKKAAARIFYPFTLVTSNWRSNVWLTAVVVAFLGIAMVFVAFKEKKTPRGVSWLSWLGLYTIDIYVISLAGNHFMPRILAGPMTTGVVVVRVLAVLTITAVTVLFSLFVSIFVLRQNRVLKFLFLGKTDGARAVEVVEPVTQDATLSVPSVGD